MIKTGRSLLQDSTAAANEISKTISQPDVKLVNFYTSSNYDIKVVASVLKGNFPAADVIGCTTAGEISDQGFSNNSLVAMSIGNDKIARVAASVITDLQTQAGSSGETLKQMSESLGLASQNLDGTKYAGIILIDGLSGKEEAVMNALGDAAPQLLIVGASAGDDLKFTSTQVALNGEVYSDAAVLALLEMVAPFEVVKTTSYKPTDKVFEITKADKENRIVYEFNGRNAVDVYKEAVGSATLDASVFMSNPVGIVVEDEAFIRSPQQVLEGDKGIKFYCQIEEGSVVNLCKATDMVKDNREMFNMVRQSLGTVSGGIIFNCILRYLEIDAEKINQDIVDVFEGTPTVGFNTYGEELITHINQTVTALFIK